MLSEKPITLFGDVMTHESQHQSHNLLNIHQNWNTFFKNVSTASKNQTRWLRCTIFNELSLGIIHTNDEIDIIFWLEGIHTTHCMSPFSKYA